MRRHGFTLIELMVVVAVVALLASILLPALSAARDQGRQAACLSNLRGMMLGVALYAQDNKDWLPAAEPSQREFPDARHWFMNAALLRQIGLEARLDHEGTPLGPARTGSILICPSHLLPDRWRDGTSLTYALSYALNGTWGLGGRPDHVAYRRSTEFPRPADVLAFADACGIGLAPGIVLYHGCPMDNFDFRHCQRINVACLDGHAATMAKHGIPFGMQERYTSFWSAKEPGLPGQ